MTNYINTDLILVSSADISALAATLEHAGLYRLECQFFESTGLWHATFASDEQFSEPEQSLLRLLGVIEPLMAQIREVWDGCSERNMDVGFECGDEPFDFHKAISNSTIGRVAATGAALNITLYGRAPAPQGLNTGIRSHRPATW